MSATRAYFAVIMFVGAAASIPFVVTAATSVIVHRLLPLKHVRTCALPILIVALPHSRQGQGNFY